MTTIFCNNRSNFPIRADRADPIEGSDCSDTLLGRDAGNLAVRLVATGSITFALSVSLVALTWAQTATADSPRLKGAYGFTGTVACLSTAAPGPGFNPNFTPTDGSFGQSFTSEGIRTFNGDGTGTVTGSSMGITIPANVHSAGSDDFSFSFTYTVNDDGSWTSDVIGVETGTIKTGPRAGQTFTISNSPTSTGIISQNGSTLTLATLDPTVEIVTFSNGDVHKRICHRSRVLIKLQDGD
ncbi:MAG TPA: hypothetical protein VKC66_07685 [Xanthobacteraceae bacterium]|nr:hypothetical protein [Xanthobacteraceae bacterium]